MHELTSTPAMFLEHLAETNCDEVVDFFLFEGTPFAFKSDWSAYCAFKKEVADRLAVARKSVVLVGSGRLGFSVKPSPEKKKLWKPFHARSDFDVVVVDNMLFDRAWKESLIQEGKNDVREDIRVLNQRRRNFYEGFVSTWHLPEGTPFVDWWDGMFAEISTQPWHGSQRTCNGMLFRDWSHAQRLYTTSFRRILREVKKGRLPEPPEKWPP